MGPLVTDWAQEEAKMAKIVRINSCLLPIILFLSRLRHNFFSQVDSTKGVLPNNKFFFKNSFHSFEKKFF